MFGGVLQQWYFPRQVQASCATATRSATAVGAQNTLADSALLAMGMFFIHKPMGDELVTF